MPTLLEQILLLFFELRLKKCVSYYLSRTGCSYWVNQKFSLTNASVSFQVEGTSLKYKNKRNNNAMLSKSTLRHLQEQCTSIWALVFYYCISNNLPREKAVTQM